MSTGRVLSLIGLAGAFVAFVAAILPEKWLKAFRKWVNGLGATAHPSIAGFGKTVVGGLLLTLACVVFGFLLSFTDNSGLPPGTSAKVTNEYIHQSLTILKYVGLGVGGLIALTLVVSVIIGALWLLARLIAVLPLTPRFYAAIALVIALVVFVLTWITS